jgi:hypothetical protein
MQIAANRHNSVWRYNCVNHGDCVVKVIRRGSGDIGMTIAAFENEVRAYTALSHLQGQVVPFLHNYDYIDSVRITTALVCVSVFMLAYVRVCLDKCQDSGVPRASQRANLTVPMCVLIDIDAVDFRQIFSVLLGNRLHLA